ncbi:MAG: hypothetical protein ABI345_06740 [Jatrophihabitans sp.]
MSLPAVGRLRVLADLHLVVDGLDATVVGDGSAVTVTTTDPSRLLTSAARANPTGTPLSLRSLSAALARSLNDADISVALVGSRGTVLRVGAGCDSRLGHVLVGTHRVEIDAYRDLIAAVVGYLRSSPSFRTRAASAVGGLVLAGLIVNAASQRRSSR